MTVPTHAPITQALVTRIRVTGSPYDLLIGGIHEGFAPEKASYPFAVYNLVYGPYDWDWTSPTLIAGIDLSVFSRNSVEADNLDAALADWLDNQPFPVPGQSTVLRPHRVATLPTPPDMDEEGQKVYQAGGQYEIWTTV